MSKKIFIVLAILVLAAVGLYLFLLKRYSVPPETFQNWHTSLKAGIEDAQARKVPIMVKIGTAG